MTTPGARTALPRTHLPAESGHSRSFPPREPLHDDSLSRRYSLLLPNSVKSARFFAVTDPIHRLRFQATGVSVGRREEADCVFQQCAFLSFFNIQWCNNIYFYVNDKVVNTTARLQFITDQWKQLYA